MTDLIASEPDGVPAARHLAAKAIMALRAGFPVENIILRPEIEGKSRIMCDWTSCRGTYVDEVTLLRRAFAFVYIGTILDQASGGVPSTDLANEIISDQSESQRVREIAVNWGIAKSVMETNPFAHVGYKLASQIARLDAVLIDQLAAELVQKGNLDQTRLDAWYAAHALPLSLTELERSGTY